MNVSAERISRQIESVLTAWGMEAEAVKTTVGVMTDTDLSGVDSHGIAMLTLYEELRSRGQLNFRAHPKVVREGPASALIDADNGLGHPAGVMGMRLAVDKARTAGVGVVSVFRSAHFGAAGYYAAIAANEGFLGLVASSARGVLVVPTRAAGPLLGTNPLAFAAPARRNRPFVLDMATSTAAMNKVKALGFKGRTLPAGWVLDEAGKPVTDPADAMARFGRADAGGLTPLGGTQEMASYKGYGLAMMVQILAATLSGASFSPIRNRTLKAGEPDTIGHFFMAIDPKAFRPLGAFEDDLDAAIDLFHGAPATDPDFPVLVAGDPEQKAREIRLREGVPIPSPLLEKIQGICERCGVAFVLKGDGAGKS